MSGRRINVVPLPPPECGLGYPSGQLDVILGGDRPTFDKWMNGQTMAICDGRKYNYGTHQYDDDGCGPHGVVVYSWDVKKFFSKSRWIDID